MPPLRRFFDKGGGGLVLQTRRQRAAKDFCALGAADIGRDDGHPLMAAKLREMFDKHRYRFEIRRRAAEGILEGGEIMDIHGHNRVGAASLEEPGHVFRRDRVARLGAPVLARIAEIGDDRGHPLGAGVLERADEKQQPAEFVVRALLGVAVERMDHQGVLAAYLGERPGLVFAVFEPAFLVLGEHQVEMGRDPRAKIPRTFERK